MYNMFLLCLAMTAMCAHALVGPTSCLKRLVSGPTNLCGGQNCDSLGPNMICYKEECLCDFGYRLENGECVQNCSNGEYGNTYIEYTGASLTCPSPPLFSSSARNLMYCEIACNAKAQCLSFTFDTATNQCYTKRCDPLYDVFNPAAATPPQLDLNAPETSTLYVKNCP